MPSNISMPQGRSIDLAETSNQISGIVLLFFWFLRTSSCNRFSSAVRHSRRYEERRTMLIVAYNINCSPHMRMRAQSRQSREKTEASHHHRINKGHKTNTNKFMREQLTFCAISRSLIQSHAAIENRHANNTPGQSRSRMLVCVAQCAPSQPI